MRARQLIEHMHGGDLPRRVTEGTVIILNGDDSAAPTSATDPAVVQKVLAQLLGGALKPSSDSAQPVQPVDPASIGVQDRFEMNRGGRRWKFKVQRDAEGQITGLDVVS